MVYFYLRSKLKYNVCWRSVKLDSTPVLQLNWLFKPIRRFLNFLIYFFSANTAAANALEQQRFLSCYVSFRNFISATRNRPAVDLIIKSNNGCILPSFECVCEISYLGSTTWYHITNNHWEYYFQVVQVVNFLEELIFDFTVALVISVYYIL